MGRPESPTLTARRRLTQAFTEWERRAREEPDRYRAEVAQMAPDGAAYGERATSYLLHLLSEIPLGHPGEPERTTSPVRRRRLTPAGP